MAAEHRAVTGLPELAEALYSVLMSRGATIECEFDNMEVLVPREPGPDAPQARSAGGVGTGGSRCALPLRDFATQRFTRRAGTRSTRAAPATRMAASANIPMSVLWVRSLIQPIR